MSCSFILPLSVVLWWQSSLSQTLSVPSAVSSSASSSCFCVNGGKCSSDGTQCLCPPGFDGVRCEKCVTNSRCRGFCQVPGGCACPEGKGGQFCEKDLEFCARHSPCQNGATCLNNPEGFYTCECPSGFGGRNCERRLTGCAERPCRNGARCVPQLMLNSVTGFRCDCPPGFFGQFCQARVTQGCADLPCQNGGSCADSPPPFSSSPIPARHRRVPPFFCLCANGWAGQICDQPLENCRVNSCQNGASCAIDPNSSIGFVCRCPHGWRGILCGEREDECGLMKPCQNGGICVDGSSAFRCVCRKGFGGELCQEKLEEFGAERMLKDKGTPRGFARSSDPPCSPSSSVQSVPVSSLSVPIFLLIFLLFAFLFSLITSRRLFRPPPPSSSSSSSSSSAIPPISTIPRLKTTTESSSTRTSSSKHVDIESAARYVCEPTFRIGPQSRQHLEESVMSAMGSRKPTRSDDRPCRGGSRESGLYEEIGGEMCCQRL
ncbi:hypothetical protein GPALN_012731 [Globodera pallida]|nr:hypothetical protein GPALN_012731 [Globodera pallida]